MWWFIFAIGSGLSAAFMAILIKLYLSQVNPPLVALIMFIVGVIVLLLADLLTHRIDIPAILSFTLAEWLALAVVGIVNALGFAFFFAALQSGKASWVVAVDRLSIVYVIIMSFFLLQEKITSTTVIGGIMMVLGAAILSR